MADFNDAEEGTGEVEKKADPTAKVRRWVMELDAYHDTAKKWEDDAKRIVRRYALEDSRSSESGSAPDERFNILWSNVQTIAPALFAQEPVPVVQRRHKDPDPVGRVAAQILERALITEMEGDGWLDVFDQLTLDVLLVARGVPWVRYDADIREVNGDDDQPEERLAGEHCPIDYIHWSDFAHAPLKTWPEVVKNGWVARRVRMTRRQLRARFPKDIADKVPVHFKPPGVDDAVAERMKPVMGRADVWEIWDAVDKKVIWLCKEYTDRILDEVDDPLGLDGFYPTPMPAFGSRSNETLIPNPDYLQYEPLAEELDEVTERISKLIPAVRAAGFYHSGGDAAIGRLFTDEAGENTLIPVEVPLNAAGGSAIGNLVEFLPIDTVAGALASLYEIRDRLSQTIYEISGVSDIIRGQVDPREKLGQSQLKGRFASQRLDKRRRAVQNAARDTIRIKAELMAERYDDDRLRELSGFDMLPEVIKVGKRAEAAVQQYQQAMQQGQMVPPPPDPRMVIEDLWTKARALLKDERLRGFRVEIETDSTIVLDQQQEQEMRNTFLQSTAPFVKQAVEADAAGSPWAPIMGDMLLYVMRAHHPGRTIESTFEEAVERMHEKARNPPPPQPDPKAEAEKAKAQTEQVKAQAAQMQAQADMQSTAQQAQVAQQKGQMDLQREQAKTEGVFAKAESDAALLEQKFTLEMQKMAAEFEVKIGELQAQLEATERQAAIKTQSGLEMAAIKRDNAEQGGGDA